ncbi:MAG: hypothetical protein KGD67_10045 [Candidatus Lokiarchaeota archaeon]|nr:hypothetical protein [Candidatus Lokiarchaeota archaeon]
MIEIKKYNGSTELCVLCRKIIESGSKSQKMKTRFNLDLFPRIHLHFQSFFNALIITTKATLLQLY